MAAFPTGLGPDATAGDIIRPGIPPVTPETSVADVIRLMVKHDTSGLAVVEDGQLVGIITESDVVTREAEFDLPTPVPFLDALFQVDAGRPYGEELRRVLATNARMLMSSPVVAIRASATLHEIATVMMERDVHPLPVVDQDGAYLGIVSRRDLVHYIEQLETQQA